MIKNAFINLILLFTGFMLSAQNPSCPSPYVYMDGSTFIKFYDPSLPLSSTNPSNTSIPTFGSGLTLMPNINGGTLTPTFYTTSGGTYWYWDGFNWVNTNHSTGNSAAVNLGGCGGMIYNIVGGTGAIYGYNGTANGTLVTTLSGFNGGGPYDLVTDCNCNFYALNTTSPTQTLTMFNGSGAPQCTYTMSGMPNTSAGGGFAIIGNMIYVKNNISNPGGFYIGSFSGSSITFTSVPNFTNSPGDFASCPVCYSSNNLTGVTIGTGSNGGVLGCTNPTVQLNVTTTVSPVTYQWSGPGIVGPANGSVITVNSPGTYSATVSAGGCPPAMATLTMAVTSNSSIVTVTIVPSGNICLAQNSTMQLVAVHNVSNGITWTGSAISPVQATNTLVINSPGTYTVLAANLNNGCTATASVVVAQKPAVSVALSDFSLCAYPTNGSPASITITASGATSYTLYPSSNFSTTAPNGPVIPVYPLANSGNQSSVATATIIGKTGFCTDTAYTAFNIIPNPTITVTPTLAAICPGLSQPFSVSGAASYTWSGSQGLNTYSGNNVIASPSVSSLYQIMGSTAGCRSNLQTASLTILPLPTVSIAPASATICLGSSVSFTAVGTGTSFTWSPGTGLSSSTGQTVTATPPYNQIYSVLAALNSCTNSATTNVTVITPPVLTIGLTSASLCAQNLNGSPNSISLFPGGANSYTLLSPGNISVGGPNGPVMQLTPVGAPPSLTTVHTLTLIGNSSVCTVIKTQTISVVPNPTLFITPATGSICPGQSKAYTASGADTYTWLPAINYSLTSPNSIVAFPAFTSFYSVNGSRAGCHSATKNAVLVVLPIPNVAIAPKSTTVCSGNTTTLVASGNGSSYLWAPSALVSSANSATVTTSPIVTQDYTVITSLNSCTNMAVATVSAITIPVISASTKNYTVCKGASTILNVQGATSYQWFPFNSLNQPSGDAVIASPLQNTTYTVHGYNGICTGSTSINITTVKPPDMTITSPANAVCSGSYLPISVHGANSYTWSPMAGLYFNGTDSIVFAAPSSNTNYTVFGSTSLGTVSCLQQLSYSVIVVPITIPKVSPSVSICPGERVTLIASGGNTFSWSPSAGINVNDHSRIVAGPTVSTIYTVDISQSTYCGASATVMVSVNPKPKVYAGRDTSYNLNDPIFIRANGTGTISWIVGESIVCPVCPETQIYPRRNTCYVAQAENDFGCQVVDDVCISVTEDFSVYIPNTFTPNNDGINDLFMIYGENISNVTMDIFNRWGVKLFSANDVTQGWNGIYNNTVCMIDVYTYVITYYGLDKKKYTRTGHVNLVK